MKKVPPAIPTETTTRKHADWETIGRQWRANALSGRAIADKHGISESGLRKQMKKMGIERDLGEEVRKSARAQLVRTKVEGEQNEREIVEAAASEQVEIIRTHQKAIGRGQEVCEAIMESLSARLANADELEAFIVEETKDDENTKRRAAMLKLIDLPAQAEVAQKLSNTMKTFIGLQRQAHGIDANPEPPKDDLMDLLAGIDGMTAGLPFKQKE